MADTKISALPAASAANLTDLLAKVNDPSGTPATQRVTLQQIKDLLHPYKVYRALLTQTGTNAPNAVVLENNLGGTVVWSRSVEGVYLGTLAGAFTTDKTFLVLSPSFGDGASVASAIYRDSSDVVSINTAIGGTLVDNELDDTPIEILVYP